MNVVCLNTAETLAQNVNLELVKFRLQSIAEQSDKDRFCFEAANSAAQNGHIKLVKLLLKNIADQTVKDQFCMKAAKSAAKNGHMQLLNFFVKIISNEDVTDQSCVNAAPSVAWSGHMELVTFLLQSISDQTAKGECCTKVVEYFAQNENMELVKLLVKNIADRTENDRCCMKAVLSVAWTGHMKMVKTLLQSIADQTEKDQCCLEAARSAAWNGHVELVKFLLQSIADQTVKDQCCLEAARSAAWNGNTELVKFLFQSIADQTVKDHCCLEAGKSAAWNGHEELVKFLLQTIADQIVKDQCCLEAIITAAQNGHTELVTFLVKSIADVTLKDQFCFNAVLSAAGNEHIELVKFVVNYITDKNVKDQCCLNAALSVAWNGHKELVTFLVQNIADRNLKDLCCLDTAKSAARNGHIELVKFLVNSITDQTVKYQCCREIAESAALHGRENIVSFCCMQPEWLFSSVVLLNYVSSLAIQGQNLELYRTLSPAQVTQLLCLSISSGNVSLAPTLLPNVSEVDLTDSSGATALMLAADAGHHELIVQLLAIGASVRAEDSHGRTALSRACQAGHVRAAKTLADRGSDASHQDHQGRTCVQLAEQFGHSQVVRLLASDSDRLAQQHCVTCRPRSIPLEGPRNDLSIYLHQLLSDAGFTERRSQCLQKMADFLEGIAKALAKDDRQMTGSYAEGWANSLVQVNGRTAADSDIDWTVLVAGQEFHLMGGCWPYCNITTQLQVTEGHAQVPVGSGSQPSVRARACGVRPAQDTCYAIECCSSYNKHRILKLGERQQFYRIHLVKATRPNLSNELRLSFSFQEKKIMRKLNTVQGQLFTLIKFIFKRHLPLNLATHGLKTYHAKTLLFFMMEKHGVSNEATWQPQNLIALFKESLDMMLSFINSPDFSSPDKCMPHFFMPDAPLYFKNAGIGGDFDNTKARVRDRLSELRNDIGEVAEQITQDVRPLQSKNFYFHPFTLLPLTPLPAVTEIRTRQDEQLADTYCVMNQCMTELNSDAADRDSLMKQLSLLQQLQWCKCAALCMTAMAHLKFEERAQAKSLMRDLAGHCVMNGWKAEHFEKAKWEYHANSWDWNCPLDSDWAWRFCFPSITQPRFPFLSEFTQTLLTARISQPRSSHLYVNFRCLSWSLQAELLHNHAAAVSAWKMELEEDPDLEELLTLAHYSDCCEHLQFCLRHLETIRDEKRVVMETQDEEKIEWVRGKLRLVAEQDPRLANSMEKPINCFGFESFNNKSDCRSSQC